VRARYLRRAAQFSIASSSLAMLDGVFCSESGDGGGAAAWLVDAASPGEGSRARLSSLSAMRAASNSRQPAGEGRRRRWNERGVSRRGGSPLRSRRGPEGRKERDGSGWF
jgi:hypothetical protein